MPAILPPGGAVDWPADEGCIGVAGVAPWATLDFQQALYREFQARRQPGKDWQYPRVIADINPKLPSRGRHLELGETDPSPFIARTIAELAAAGATVVVVPCNTAHILYGRWAADAAVPVPSIVTATVDAVAQAGAQRVAALTSASLRRHGVYGQALHARGLHEHPLDDAAAAEVAALIEGVKQQGSVAAAPLRRLRARLRRLRADGVDGIVLGCTELASLEAVCLAEGLCVAESNRALALVALRLACPTLGAATAAPVRPVQEFQLAGP